MTFGLSPIQRLCRGLRPQALVGGLSQRELRFAAGSPRPAAGSKA
jgi:hypothetical protein